MTEGWRGRWVRAAAARGTATLLCAGALACSREAPTPARAHADAVADVNADVNARTLDERLRPPSPFVRDLDRAERAADEVQRQLGGGLCDALVRERADTLRGLLTAEFLGRFVTAPEGDETPRAFTAEPLEVDAATRAADEFLERALAYRAAFVTVARCKLKPVRFFLAERDPAWAFTTLRLELAGRDALGRARVDHGELLARIERDARGEWRVAALSVQRLERVMTLGPGLVDVTEAVGASLALGDDARALQRELVDHKAVLTIGGLAALDHDDDGDEDLLVGLAGRGLWLLRNDGRGGFRREGSLLDPRDVGLFVAAVDLDGDARPELISTAVTGCQDDRARLGVFRERPGGGYERVEPSPLTFAAPCGGYSRVRLEHVAAADLDRDGLLDLVVSGYAGRDSKGADFNSFEADDGQRNLLFLGRGGLAFEERGEERGLRRRDYTYATALHDFDGDGSLDIYAVNDYGPNALLLNDGHARFSPAPPGPLTARGNSMGVSIVDLDGEPGLDVYVSNMYSSAGNRIIPLVAGAVAPETSASLLAMAAGNQLYARADGAGLDGFRERGDELGVREAGWAWGHAAFDLENDGDRDLFVVNGLTSHSDAREPDF